MKFVGTPSTPSNRRFFHRNLSSTRLQIRTSDTATTYYGHSSFDDSIAHYGAYVLQYQNSWLTVADIVGMRGSYHGYSTAYLPNAANVDIRVTLDGKIIEDENYAKVDGGIITKYCGHNASSHVSSSIVVLKNPYELHTEGAGIDFADSLKIEMRHSYQHFSNETRWALGFYYLESKI